MPNLSAANALFNVLASGRAPINIPFASKPYNFDQELPPSEIPNFDSAVDFINDQNLQSQRILADQNAISNEVDLSAQVDQIREKTQRLFGVSSDGANGFYEVDLVSFANISDKNAIEPDGFRLYLIRPETPPVAEYLKLAGRAAKGAADTIAAGSDALNKGADAIGLPVPEFLAAGKNNLEEVGKNINEWMKQAGQSFDDNFKKYLKNSYEDYPEGNSFYSAILPMPSNLVDSHNHETDDLALGALLPIVNGVATGANNFVNAFSNRVFDTSGAKLRSRGATSLLEEFGNGVFNAAEAVATEVGGLVGRNVVARLGVGINPNTETVYGSPAPRQFQFSFDFKPKSLKEVKLIQDFITRVKEHSYPLSFFGIGGQNQLYSFPGEVYFEFSGRYRGKLFRSLRPCIIKNVQVDYGGQSGNLYSHFKDGNPTSFNFSITLLEIRRLDRNILFDDRENSGIGYSDKDYRDKVKLRDTLFAKQLNDLTRNPNANFDRAIDFISNPFNSSPQQPNNFVEL